MYKTKKKKIHYSNLILALQLLSKPTTPSSVFISLISIDAYKRNPLFSNLAVLPELFSKDHTLIC